MTNWEARLSQWNQRLLDDAKRYADMDGDLCMLCRAYGADKRSLFLGCLYAVEEVVPEAISLRKVPVETNIHGGSELYYLRICKSCRGALLGMLQDWRNERVGRRHIQKNHDGADADYLDERNIPVRVNGAVQMMTRDEYDAWSETSNVPNESKESQE